MADSTDVILRLAERQWASVVRAESRLASLANTMIIAAVVLQAFVAVRGFHPDTLVLAGLMVLLGVLGMLAAGRARGQVRRGIDLFGRLAARLDELSPDAGLVALEQGPREEGRVMGVVHPALVALGALNVALVLLLGL